MHGRSTSGTAATMSHMPPFSGSDSPHHKEFVCEAMIPVAGTFDSSAMVAGEPGLPARFQWRGSEYEIARVLSAWKTTGPCTHGSGERYVRRHWYRIETTDGSTMELYFDRRPRVRQKLQRWWVATLVPPAGGSRPNGAGEATIG